MGTLVDPFARLRKGAFDPASERLALTRAREAWPQVLLACTGAVPSPRFVLRAREKLGRCSGSMRTQAKAGVHRSASVELPASPGRIVVISDTHGHPHRDALARVRAFEPAAILHAGDIGDPGVLQPFADVAPLHVVRGNIDPRGVAPDSIDVSLAHDGRVVAKIFLTHYALQGPRLLAPILRAAQAHAADLVVCGHSHVPFIGRDRGMGVFNPGSIGPRRFALPITFGVLELNAAGLTPWHVSCETGERWLPG